MNPSWHYHESIRTSIRHKTEKVAKLEGSNEPTPPAIQAFVNEILAKYAPDTPDGASEMEEDDAAVLFASSSKAQTARWKGRENPGLIRERLVADDPGRAISDAVRDSLEPMFGFNLKAARIHTGPASSAMAAKLGAKAFTIGSDIFFRSTSYDAHSASGVALIAHELTHVLQQATNSPQSLTAGAAGFEREAEDTGRRALVMLEGASSRPRIERFDCLCEIDDYGDDQIASRVADLGPIALERALEILSRDHHQPNQVLETVELEIDLDFAVLSDNLAIDQFANRIVQAIRDKSHRVAITQTMSAPVLSPLGAAVQTAIGDGGDELEGRKVIRHSDGFVGTITEVADGETENPTYTIDFGGEETAEAEGDDEDFDLLNLQEFAESVWDGEVETIRQLVLSNLDIEYEFEAIEELMKSCGAVSPRDEEIDNWQEYEELQVGWGVASEILALIEKQKSLPPEAYERYEEVYKEKHKKPLDKSHLTQNTTAVSRFETLEGPSDRFLAQRSYPGMKDLAEEEDLHIHIGGDGNIHAEMIGLYQSLLQFLEGGTMERMSFVYPSQHVCFFCEIMLRLFNVHYDRGFVDKRMFVKWVDPTGRFKTKGGEFHTPRTVLEAMGMNVEAASQRLRELMSDVEKPDDLIKRILDGELSGGLLKGLIKDLLSRSARLRKAQESSSGKESAPRKPSMSSKAGRRFLREQAKRDREVRRRKEEAESSGEGDLEEVDELELSEKSVGEKSVPKEAKKKRKPKSSSSSSDRSGDEESSKSEPKPQLKKVKSAILGAPSKDEIHPTKLKGQVTAEMLSKEVAKTLKSLHLEGASEVNSGIESTAKSLVKPLSKKPTSISEKELKLIIDRFLKGAEEILKQRKVALSKSSIEKDTGKAYKGGDCLFDSTRDSGAIDDSSDLLRIRLADEIRRNPVRYLPYLRYHNYDNILDAVEVAAAFLETPGNWNHASGDIAPIALANALNRTIIILNMNGSIRDVVGPDDDDPIFIYYNGYNHYVSSR